MANIKKGNEYIVDEENNLEDLERVLNFSLYVVCIKI